MNKSELFTLAHHETRKAFLKAKLLGQNFNYQVTFSFYLKELTNAQPQKVTTYKNGVMLVSYAKKPKINKACAMVGDYKKPTYIRDGYKVTKQINPSLSVTYNLDTIISLLISAICVICIYALALQAINHF